MIFINDSISLGSHEVEISAIRSQGSGGQSVNKVSSAIHLRFDIQSSSLSFAQKQQLLRSKDKRINRDGVLVIKAQAFRTQELNKADALERLKSFIIAATYVRKPRKRTRPSKNSQRKWVEKNKHRSRTKALRGRINI